MIAETITLIAAGIAAYIAWRFYKESKELKQELKEAQSKIKSLYVLHGHAIEKLSPLSNQLGDIRELVFLGRPLDYIGFHKNHICFYEIKSGNSKLSWKQQAIKKLINEGKIKFKELKWK